MKIVEVEWLDAHSSMDAMTISDLEKQKPILTKSCGFLIHEDQEKIILASMIYEDILDQYQVIPKGMVKKIRVIRE